MTTSKDIFEGPDHHDADILLKLYDLRRESEMRKARDWCTMGFMPTSVDDVMVIFNTTGTDHNRWLRQFITYYEMVASLVHRHILDRDLLEDSATEYVNLYSKLKPFLKELRQAIGWSPFMAGIERLVEESKRGRELLAQMQDWLAERRNTEKP